MSRSFPVKREIPRGSRGGVVGYGVNNAPAAIAPGVGSTFFLQTGSASANAAFTSLTAPGSNEEILFNNSGGMAAAGNAHYTNASIPYLSVREDQSTNFAAVEGAHSWVDIGNNVYPAFTKVGGGSAEILLSDNIQYNTMINYGMGYRAWYGGCCHEVTPGDTTQIEVYIGASGLQSLVYDTGTFTSSPLAVFNSGDMNGVIDGGTLGAGWRLDVDFYLFDRPNQYFASSVKFTFEDMDAVEAASIRPVWNRITNFQGVYGGAGDITIDIVVTDTTAGSTSLWFAKNCFTQPGIYEY